MYSENRMDDYVPHGNMVCQTECSPGAILLHPRFGDTLCMAGKGFRPTFMRQWRQHRGKTLVQVAEEMHVTHGYLSKVERGKQPYNQELLERLAELYRCEPVDLLIRDPSEPSSMWSLWDKAKPGQRRQIESVAAALLRTGTGG
jgi:transcriptional regulator with XRE-family HTH domain